MLRLIKEIKPAEYDRDFTHAAGMRNELTTLSQSPDIPLAYGASVVVPNVTQGQKSLIYRQLVRTLKTTDLKAWGKQAVKRVVHVIRATPHTVVTVFSKLSTKKDWTVGRPPCTCTEHLHTASKYGEPVTIGQHVALVPVKVNDQSGKRLRPHDPLPVPGKFARQEALKGITAFAVQVKGTTPPQSCILPNAFPKSGQLLRHVKRIGFMVRVVDKGAGQLWGFCNRWMWDCTEQFLLEGGYLKDTRSPTQYMREVSDMVQQLGWPVTKRAKLCRLYIIAKAKILWAGKGWLSRPSAASP